MYKYTTANKNDPRDAVLCFQGWKIA